jgi:multidrug efflux pump subunit AcrB
LLVDNAIVVAEATGRYKEAGMPDLEAARTATE